jgi:hypothetical protein
LNEQKNKEEFPVRPTNDGETHFIDVIA